MALAVTALLLAACGSMPEKQPPQAAAAGANAQPQAVPPSDSSLPVLPPAGSGRGAYYQDDGPGDSPPPGLLQMPDAVPRIEPYLARANRPYVVFGKRYVPIVDDRPYKERGRGSWYGKKFQGQRTSSGEPYDMYKMTAATPTLPIPSYARVTNLANGKQVIVRINDRGPFHTGRIIDLSYTAALKLGYLSNGSAELEVERLLPEEIERMAAARKAAEDGQQQAASPAPAPLAQDAAPSQAVAPADTNAAQAVVPEPTTPPAAVVAAAPGPATGAAPGFYLQFGTYSQEENAQAELGRLQQKSAAVLPPLQVAGYGLFYRVYSGPFASRADAAEAAARLQNGGTQKPLVVQR
jgi:rare lipoprotein A